MISKANDWFEREYGSMTGAAPNDGAPVAAAPGTAGFDGEFVARTLPDIYRRYWPDLCRYINRTFGRGPPEPEDIVQAAFFNFAAIDDPQAIRNPRAMLYCIARNIAIRQHQREAMIARHGRELSSLETQECLDESDPERVLMSRERVALLDAALTRMPRERRRLLILNRLHGLSYAEISRRTGISQTQVKRLVAWALTDCKRALRSGS